MSRGALSALVAVLVVVGCSGGRDKTLADLQSARPEVRAMAVKRLSERFEADDVSLFSQAARDPVSIVRAEAMAALGKTQDSRIVDLLGEGLADSDEQVQQAAAAALASFKTDKARSYLTLQYSRRGRTTRMAIVQALKGTNIPGAMASVVVAEAKAIWDRNMKVLSDGSLPERIGAAEELGRSGRPEAVNRLVPLLKDKHVGLAAAAARGLGLARDPRAAPAVTALLDENYPELREAACEALGRLGEPSALPKLLVVAQELALVKIRATDSNRAEILKLVDLSKGRVVDLAGESVIVEVTGPEHEVDGFVALVRNYGIKEIVRTGAVVMSRGSSSIEEAIKR